MTEAELETLVDQAAEFLDGLAPGWWSEDWTSPIDLSGLAMMSTRWCVAGQAFEHLATSHGACCTPSGYDYVLLEVDKAGRYSEIADAFAIHSAGPVWKALITHRRALYRQQVSETPFPMPVKAES